MASVTDPQETLKESDKSTDPALLNSYRKTLEKNTRVLIAKLKADLIFSKIKKHLPKEDIVRINNALKLKDIAQLLVYSLMRNLSTVGLYNDFRNAVREEQPDLFPLLAEEPDTVILNDKAPSIIFEKDPGHMESSDKEAELSEPNGEKDNSFRTSLWNCCQGVMLLA